MKAMIAGALIMMAFFVSCDSAGETRTDRPFGEDYDFWVTIEQAQEMAYDRGKHIVLDIYTEWCGFCRRMNQETYGDERVQDALERYFYPVRIDAESEREITFLNQNYTMMELAYQFGVQSYPTTVFLSPSGEPIAVQPGFIDAGEFNKMLNYVGSGSYQSESYQDYSISDREQ